MKSMPRINRWRRRVGLWLVTIAGRLDKSSVYLQVGLVDAVRTIPSNRWVPLPHEEQVEALWFSLDEFDRLRNEIAYSAIAEHVMHEERPDLFKQEIRHE